MPKLTKTAVDNAQPPASGDAWLWDSELEGFGVRIIASGRKTYVVRYRTKAGNTQRKMTVARCSDVPPEKARELARKVFSLVAQGFDPVGDKRIKKECPTVQQLCTKYMKEHAKPFKKKRSVELDEKNWRLHILPVLGAAEVAEVKRSDILSLHGSLADTPATANQVLALLSKAFNLSEDWEWRPRNSNPCHKIKKYDLQERETILSLADIKRLYQTLNDLLQEGKILPQMYDLIRLLMLTGCRLREIMSAKRSWVDLERALLLLPDSKVGQRKISLPDICMTIIAEMPDSEWLIPNRTNDGPLADPYRQWKAIKVAAGLPLEMRIHDLRHTAGSLAHMAGMSQKQIAILLGHAQLSTTARYLHGAAGDHAVVATKLGDVITGAWSNAA
jgi:integrase